MAELVKLDAILTASPTVLVAAGGTGLDMVERIVKKQSEMYGDGSWQAPPKTKVVLIDTNTDELKTSKEKLVNLGANVATIELEFGTVEQALRRYQNNPTFMAILRAGGLVRTTHVVNGDIVLNKDGQPEVDKNLVKDAQRQILNIQGAAQNPAFSRMAFFSKFEQYATILEEAIQSVTSDGYTGDAPRVMVFMSAFGGTGSGVALPVLYALRSRYTGDELKIDLYLFDGSFARDVSLDRSFERTAQLNTIRIERELDVVTCDAALDDPILPEPDDRHNGLFSNGNGRFKFDDVYLFSKRVFGGKGDNVSFEEAKESVAAAVVNRVFLQRAGAAKGFENQAFKRNRGGSEYVCSLSGMPRDYCSMASSSISFPSDDALNFVVEKNLYRALKNLSGGSKGIFAKELSVDHETPCGYASTAVNTLAREAIEELERKLTAPSFQQRVPASLPALASQGKAAYEQVAAAMNDCKREIDGFVDDAIRNAASSGSQAKTILDNARSSVAELAQKVKDIREDRAKESKKCRREADALAVENLKRSKYRDEYTEQYRNYAVAACCSEIMNKIFDLLRHANERLEQAINGAVAANDKVQKLIDDVEANYRKLLARMKDGIRSRDPSYELVTEEWLAELAKIELDNAAMSELRVNERVARAARPAEGMNNVRRDIRNALAGKIPNVVERFVQMLDSDAENSLAKRKLQRTFELSSPHFAIREDGVERMQPSSYCYCLVPWDKTKEEFSTAFEEVVGELNFQQAGVGSRDVILVPSCVLGNIVFVQVLAGLRPNFAKEFPKMKLAYKNYGRSQNSWRITLSVEQNDWYNDAERKMYGSENPNKITRNPEDINQL